MNEPNAQLYSLEPKKNMGKKTPFKKTEFTIWMNEWNICDGQIHQREVYIYYKF